MFTILIAFMVSQVCTFMKTYQIAHFKYVHFVCQLYLNKTVNSKINFVQLAAVSFFIYPLKTWLALLYRNLVSDTVGKTKECVKCFFFRSSESGRSTYTTVTFYKIGNIPSLVEFRG